MNLVELVEQSRFTPTPAQIRRRKEFWAKEPQLSDTPSLDDVMAAGAYQAVSRWWKTPGFAEWFTDRNSNLHAAEELLHRAMDRIQNILMTSEDADTLIAAAKEARTLHAQMLTATAADEKFADEQVSNMSRTELEDYIRKNSAKIAANTQK
jgi:hypothetical protein